MAKGFRPVVRDQGFLLPPDMCDWLAADHLVWFVLDTVAALDLVGFVERRRLGGAGRAAYDPRMMVALLIYAYAVGQRSSRQIERLCSVDVAFRIACGQDAPDHATIARFRAEHEQPLAELFEQVLRLCFRAGMGRLGTVALDGTKIAANASPGANRSESALRRMAGDILAEAAAADADEDARFGDARGDELPAPLADPAGRAQRIKDMLADIDAERAARAAAGKPAAAAERRAERARQGLERTRERVRAQAEQRAEREAAATAAGTAIPGTRPVPVDEHSLVRAARARLARAEQHLADTRAPQPPAPGSSREPKRNLTDPDSRMMKAPQGWIQGYNCQSLVSADYLIIAADVGTDAFDVGQYQPMVATACATITALTTDTGADRRIGCVLADAGYASTANLTARGPDRLIALGTSRDLTNAAKHHPAAGDPAPGATARDRMDHRLRSPDGAALYRQRAAIVEPVHAHLKDRRNLRRFARRGLPAARSEYRFAAAVTNLLRLRTHLTTG